MHNLKAKFHQIRYFITCKIVYTAQINFLLQLEVRNYLQNRIMTDSSSKVKGQGHKSRSNKQNIPKLSIMSLYHDENRSYILSFTHGSSEQSLNDNIIENSN